MTPKEPARRYEFTHRTARVPECKVALYRGHRKIACYQHKDRNVIREIIVAWIDGKSEMEIQKYWESL